MAIRCYNLSLYGGYSSVAERRSVAPDVVGSTPTSRPNRSALTPLHSFQAVRPQVDQVDGAGVNSPSPSKTASAKGPVVWMGCSGWAYPTWKPDFYPAKTPAKKLLEYYATQLNSVEVNYTFRQLPSTSTIEGWLAQTGPEFRFSFKAPQRITHIKRLHGSPIFLRKLRLRTRAESGSRSSSVMLRGLPKRSILSCTGIRLLFAWLRAGATRSHYFPSGSGSCGFDNDF